MTHGNSLGDDRSLDVTVESQLEIWPPESTGELLRQLSLQLIDMLERISSISSPGERALLLETVEDRLGGLGLRDHPRPRAFFVELVRLCSQRTGGLVELGACVHLFAAGDPACGAVQHIIEQLEALTVEPSLEPVWSSLRLALSAVPLAEAQSVIVHVTDGRVGMLPSSYREPWSAFVHLVGHGLLGAEDPLGEIPPWLAFLELMRDRLDDDTGRLVRTLVRRLARNWDCTDELERLRARFDARTPRVLKAGVLSIVMTPDPADPDSFTLYSVQRWDDDETSSPFRDADVVVRKDDLQATVERAVARAEEDWAIRSADLQIEFVMPLPLLNEPVEWWPKDSRNPPTVPLALYHPIVVRSFERLRTPSWHRVWLRRWERLVNEPATGRVLWSDPDRIDHLRRMEAELASDDGYLAVVLSEPPSGDVAHAQEIVVALRAGVPLIIWHRAGLDTFAVRQLVREILTPLGDVPDRITDLRRRIERLGPDQRDAHPGRELSVLWDNAHRAPEVARLRGA